MSATRRALSQLSQSESKAIFETLPTFLKGPSTQERLDASTEFRWSVAQVTFVAASTVLFDVAWSIPSNFVRSVVTIGITTVLFALLTEVLEGCVSRNRKRFLPLFLRFATLLALVALPVTLPFAWAKYVFGRKHHVSTDTDVPLTTRSATPPRPEHEELEPPIIDLGAGRLVVDANLSLTDLGRYLGVELPNPESFSSIGRLLVARYGSIPPIGTKLNEFGFDFVVHDVRKDGVTKVEIQRPFSLRDTYSPLSARVSPPDSEPP